MKTRVNEKDETPADELLAKPKELIMRHLLPTNPNFARVTQDVVDERTQLLKVRTFNGWIEYHGKEMQCEGFVDTDRNLIRLSRKSVAGNTHIDTLIHEIIHTLFTLADENFGKFGQTFVDEGYVETLTRETIANSVKNGEKIDIKMTYIRQSVIDVSLRESGSGETIWTRRRLTAKDGSGTRSATKRTCGAS
jgi:ferritin